MLAAAPQASQFEVFEADKGVFEQVSLVGGGRQQFGRDDSTVM